MNGIGNVRRIFGQNVAQTDCFAVRCRQRRALASSVVKQLDLVRVVVVARRLDLDFVHMSIIYNVRPNVN